MCEQIPSIAPTGTLPQFPNSTLHYALPLSTSHQPLPMVLIPELPGSVKDPVSPNAVESSSETETSLRSWQIDPCDRKLLTSAEVTIGNVL
jgi:hypothetical protein